MKKKRVPKAFDDLTINDSANAAKPVKRPSKKGSGQSSQPLPECDTEVIEMEPEDTANPVRAILKPVPAPVAPSEPPTSYRQIPPEIWILISSKIRPEDVSTFAAICRATHDVTRRAYFWTQLYRRFGPQRLQYGGLSQDIPMRLRPESMVRLGGLRSCVVRTLFYTYPPFCARMDRLNRNLDLTSFKGRLKLRQMWSVQLKEKLWCYFFRLQAPQAGDASPRRSSGSAKFKDVLENPDEGCRLLAIESSKIVPLPQVFNEPQQIYLQSVTYNMSHGLRNYKANLELATYNEAAFAKLVIDPALSIKVWDWWCPAYHEVRAQEFVPEQEDSYFDL